VLVDSKNIVAVATSPSSDAALNVVRCSGKTIFSIYKKVTKKTSEPRANSAFLHKIHNHKGRIIDSAIVLCFKGPKSFTGEDMIEFSIHGGSVVLKNLIDCLLSFGCRLAEPGEFTYRAFLNGKIDLVQAESINSLIRAQTSREAALALNNIAGKLSSTLKVFSNKVENIIAIMEHELDFNDSEIDFVREEDYIQQIKEIVKATESVLSSSFAATESLEHTGVCLVGKTNVGKSSLFNLMLGSNRSITSAEAGTTRDVVSEGFEINRSIVRLVDTAGLRKSKNNVEKRGMKKTKQEILKSDILVFVDDKDPIKEFSKLNIKHQNVIWVLNKQDKSKKQTLKKIIKTSCKSKFGVSLLVDAVKNMLKNIEQKESLHNRFLLNLRQKKELLCFKKELVRALSAFKTSHDLVVVLSFLYNARGFIQSVSKPVDKDEILNRVFGAFCVGK